MSRNESRLIQYFWFVCLFYLIYMSHTVRVYARNQCNALVRFRNHIVKHLAVCALRLRCIVVASINQSINQILFKEGDTRKHCYNYKLDRMSRVTGIPGWYWILRME